MLHDESLAEHGGAAGLRDEALLDSALARPLNLVAYGKPDAADLAAACSWAWRRITRSSMATSVRRFLQPVCS